MARALRLAERGLFTTTPNPRVGCVVVRGGEVVGEGFHERAGEAHAEVNALRAAGGRAEGGTVYVNLEPCSHHGRTPPCIEALVAAGVKRVVVAMGDPNPKVVGAGLRRAPCRGRRGRLRTARGRGAGAERRLRVAHDARPAVGAAEGRRDPGRQDRARERREPVDHRRGGAPRRPSLARAGLRDPHRDRHGQGRRSAAHGARRRNAAPAAPGARGLAPGGAALRTHPRRRESARRGRDRGPGEDRRAARARRGGGRAPERLGQGRARGSRARARPARAERGPRRGGLQAQRLARRGRGGGRAAGLPRAEGARRDRPRDVQPARGRAARRRAAAAADGRRADRRGRPPASRDWPRPPASPRARFPRALSGSRRPPSRSPRGR